MQENAQQKLLRAIDALKVITVNGFEKAMESYEKTGGSDDDISSSSSSSSSGVEINGVKDDKNNTSNGASS